MCQSCGEQDESGDAYCATPGCGASLPAEALPAAAEAEVAMAPVPPQAPIRSAYRPWMSLTGAGVVAVAAFALLIPRSFTRPQTPPAPNTQVLEPPVWTVPPASPTPSPDPGSPAAGAPTAAPVPPQQTTARPNPPRTTSATQTRPPTTTGAPPPQTQPCSALDGGSDSNNVNIPDGGAPVYSSLIFSGFTGNASSVTRVHVDIKHTFRGDLAVDLVGPNGSSYRLKNADLGDSTDNINVTYTVNASAQQCGGQWRLKVQDIDAEGDFTGYIDAWSIAFQW